MPTRSHATIRPAEVHVAGPIEDEGCQRCLRCDALLTLDRDRHMIPIGALVAFEDDVPDDQGRYIIRSRRTLRPYERACRPVPGPLYFYL